MKKRIIFFLFFVSFILSAFSQSGVHNGGGKYIKRIENNLYVYGMNEFRSKTEPEKRFFGDFNAPVEFFYEPAFEGASGFRLVKDSLVVSLELKYITNYKEAKKELDGKYSSTYLNDLYQLVNIESRLVPISEQFAEELFEKMVYFIDNFKAKVIPAIIFDGYSVTFRTVVDENEQWSLWIHMPKGDALRMANLCLQIITDGLANKLDEQKYMTVLSTFDVQ
jgi:hypothetical protein